MLFIHYYIMKFVNAVCENHLKGFAVGKLSLLSFLAMGEVWEEADIFWHLFHILTYSGTFQMLGMIG